MEKYMETADIQIAIKCTLKNKSRVSTLIGSENNLPQYHVFAKEASYHILLFLMGMDLVIKDVHQNNPDNVFVLGYEGDYAQTATSKHMENC